MKSKYILGLKSFSPGALLYPCLRLDERYSTPVTYELFRNKSPTDPIEFLWQAVASHEEGYWYDESEGGKGISWFLSENDDVSEVSLAGFLARTDGRLRTYFSEGSDFCTPSKIDSIVKVFDSWDRKVFLILTKDEVIVCCYSNSD